MRRGRVHFDEALQPVAKVRFARRRVGPKCGPFSPHHLTRGECAESEASLSRNSSGAKLARLRRQTIQVCAPGVSMSVCWTALDLSHSRNLRLMSMRRSSVPQAIQSRCSCALALESSPGKVLSKSSLSPPELNAPIQEKRSSAFKPTWRDSAPPIESPAMARELRSADTR